MISVVDNIQSISIEKILPHLENILIALYNTKINNKAMLNQIAQEIILRSK